MNKVTYIDSCHCDKLIYRTACCSPENLVELVCNCWRVLFLCCSSCGSGKSPREPLSHITVALPRYLLYLNAYSASALFASMPTSARASVSRRTGQPGIVGRVRLSPGQGRSGEIARQASKSQGRARLTNCRQRAPGVKLSTQEIGAIARRRLEVSLLCPVWISRQSTQWTRMLSSERRP